MHNSSEQYCREEEYTPEVDLPSYGRRPSYNNREYASEHNDDYLSIERPRRRMTEREMDIELERRINSGLSSSALERVRRTDRYSEGRSTQYPENSPRHRYSDDYVRQPRRDGARPAANGQNRPRTPEHKRPQSARPVEQRPRQVQNGARPQQRSQQPRPVRRRAPMTPMEKLAYALKNDSRYKVGAVLVLLIIIVIILICVLSGGKAPKDTVVPQQPAETIAATATAAPTAEIPVATPQPAAQNEALQAPVSQPAAQSQQILPSVTMVADYTLLMEKLTTDKALGLPECARVEHSYFNDTVFVGDSVSKKLQMYVTNERKNNPNLLGTANFLTAQSFSARNALKNVSTESIHPVYQGVKMPLEDVIAKSGVKKVYIMLGLNDVGISGVDEAVKNMLNLLRLIKEKSPDVQIFVQSATPRLSGNHPTTEQLYAYNVKLYEYILQLKEHQIYFVDVAYIMRDESGKLYEEYCSDPESMALHFNNTACEKWIDYLYTHALV